MNLLKTIYLVCLTIWGLLVMSMPSCTEALNSAFSSILQEETVMSYLTLLADFREEVRKKALEVKGE